MRDQSNKNKYFFAMSPFKVVYLCTFISISISLAYCEWLSVFNKQAFAHSVFFFFALSKRYLNVNFDDMVDPLWNKEKKKRKSGLSLVQWKVTLAQMDQKRNNNNKKKKCRNRASHHHVTTSIMGFCLLLFRTLRRVQKKVCLFHAVFDKSYNLSVLV